MRKHDVYIQACILDIIITREKIVHVAERNRKSWDYVYGKNRI